MSDLQKRSEVMALSSVYKQIVDTVHSEIQIKYNGILINEKFIGVWDTGANKTVINLDLARRLGLIRVDERQVSTANDIRMAGVYFVDLILPNGVNFPDLEIIDGVMKGIDFLIGMDIINQGDFAITNKGKTVMSYRKPSVESIDYVTETNKARVWASKRQLGKKDPCWCNSGKQFGQCHGKR